MVAVSVLSLIIIVLISFMLYYRDLMLEARKKLVKLRKEQDATRAAHSNGAPYPPGFEWMAAPTFHPNQASGVGLGDLAAVNAALHNGTAKPVPSGDTHLSPRRVARGRVSSHGRDVYKPHIDDYDYTSVPDNSLVTGMVAGALIESAISTPDTDNTPSVPDSGFTGFGGGETGGGGAGGSYGDSGSNSSDSGSYSSGSDSSSSSSDSSSSYDSGSSDSGSSSTDSGGW